MNSGISQSSNPKIDVIIPFHKVDDYLAESIRSVKASIGVQVRIIAVNDTLQDVQPTQIGLAEQDILIESKVKGYTGALSTGIAVCSSELVAFQDSDDLTDPERLIKQSSYLRKNNYDLVTGKLIKTDRFGSISRNKSIFGEISDFFPVNLKLILGPHGADSSVLGYRFKIQETWKEHTEFAPNFADYGWMLKLQASSKIGHCRDAIYYYRSHREQMSRNTSDISGWYRVFPIWLENFRNTFYEAGNDKDKFSMYLEKHPLVGLCIAFPSALPRLSKEDQLILKMAIEWIMKQSINLSTDQTSLLKETLYRRGYIGTRCRSLRFWPAGLRMINATLYSYFKGIRPRMGKGLF